MTLPHVTARNFERFLPDAPIMSAKETARAMGFRTVAALAKSRLAGRLPIPMFKVAGRHGWFASTEVVRTWLEETIGATTPSEKRT